MNKNLLKIFAIIFTSISIVALNSNTTEAKSEKPVKIYLVRHGETTANVMHLAQGWSDFTLTQNGVEGAKYLGLGLKGTKFSSAYSGDLSRQEKTAKGALEYSGNKKIPLKIDQNLRECNYGSYEGRADMAQNIPDIINYFGYKDVKDFMTKTGKDVMNKMQDGYYALDKENKLNTPLPNEYRAESSDVVEKRMTKALTNIAKKQEKHHGGNVLVVSSGMSINIFLNGQKFPEYKGEGIKNDAVTELTYKDGKFKLSSEIGSLKYFNEGKKISK